MNWSLWSITVTFKLILRHVMVEIQAISTFERKQLSTQKGYGVHVYVFKRELGKQMRQDNQILCYIEFQSISVFSGLVNN